MNPRYDTVVTTEIARPRLVSSTFRDTTPMSVGNSTAVPAAAAARPSAAMSRLGAAAMTAVPPRGGGRGRGGDAGPPRGWGGGRGGRPARGGGRPGGRPRAGPRRWTTG